MAPNVFRPNDFRPKDRLPSDLAVAGERLGAVSVDARPAVDLTNRHRTQRCFVGPGSNVTKLFTLVIYGFE